MRTWSDVIQYCALHIMLHITLHAQVGEAGLPWAVVAMSEEGRGLIVCGFYDCLFNLSRTLSVCVWKWTEYNQGHFLSKGENVYL